MTTEKLGNLNPLINVKNNLIKNALCNINFIGPFLLLIIGLALAMVCKVPSTTSCFRVWTLESD